MRKVLFVVVILSALIGGSLCSVSFAADNRGPIKVGWLAPMTGPWAEVGKDMTNGFTMYMEEVGYKAAGRKIEVIKEDSRANPETAVTKFRKLVTHDRVAVAGGLVTAPNGLAVAAIANQLKTPMIIACSAADDNTQRRRNPWTTRIGWAGSQPMFPFGEWVAKKLGYKRIAAIAVDFQFGYDTLAAFQQTFEANGGKIVQKQWAPVNTVDYGPYLARMTRNADAVWANMVGSMSLKFPKQYKEAGINLPLIGNGTVSDEYVLPAQGDEILGFISPLHYSGALDTPANTAFQKKYQAKYKKHTSYYAENCYDLAMWLVKAIEAVNGKVEDKENFRKAITQVQLDNPPRGKFKMDKYGNPIQNIYIRKVEKIDGYKLDFLNSGPTKWNIVIDTIPAVSQFWKYDPEEYMKRPVYSRDYPPCKYCQ
jgi:branched-chain amino acid transport system substrate-binding protein